MRSGDARTTLLAEVPELASTGEASPAAIATLDESAARPEADELARPARAELRASDGERSATCPMSGTVIEVRAAVGDLVRSGDPLLVVSAMKTEAAASAPCAGTVVALIELAPGDLVDVGTVVALVSPGDVGAGRRPPRTRRRDVGARARPGGAAARDR